VLLKLNLTLKYLHPLETVSLKRLLITIRQVNPLYLAVGVTLTASNAFMLPVSTPSNAIVYTAGGIRYKPYTTLIKKKTKLSSYSISGNSDGIRCKVIYEEGLPNI
jgi:hypothetical protein